MNGQWSGGPILLEALVQLHPWHSAIYTTAFNQKGECIMQLDAQMTKEVEKRENIISKYLR